MARCVIKIGHKWVTYCRNADIERKTKWPSGTRFYKCTKCECVFGVEDTDDETIVLANGQEVGRCKKSNGKNRRKSA